MKISKKARKELILSRNKLIFLGISFTALIICLLIQIFSIKNIHGEEYERLAVSQQVNQNNIEKNINPIRGSILDRNEKTLAVSRPVYDVILDVRKLAKADEEVKTFTIKSLNQYLEIPIEILNSYIKLNSEGRPAQDTHYFKIAKKIEKQTAMDLEATGAKHISFETGSIRQYSFDNLASQALGLIRGDAYWGLEAQYNSEMTGTAGRIFKTYDSFSNVVTTRIEPEDGYSVVTTLDLDIQRFAEEAVLQAGMEFEPKYASVIVMNPNTAEVLAMAQYPSFNPNDPENLDFLGNIAMKEELEALENKERIERLFEVWTNFNISKSYEPGSIFKPMFVSAAIEEGLVNEHSSYYCGGKKYVGDREIRCWERKGHGNQTLMQAVANSCNVAMMDISAVMGREIFFKYQHDFGFGEKTGIDLPWEFSAANLLNPIEKLNSVELATGSMGQGFNCTSIQALTAFAAVINGGNLMQPYIVSQVIDKNNRVVYENSEKVVRKVISKETSDFMRKELQKVVSPDGTGRKGVIKGYNIGGKTGTGEQVPRDHDLYAVSFIGYLPVENPEYIALAVIYLPKEYKEYMQGSTTAAPLIKKLFIDIINNKRIRPTGEVDPKDEVYVNSHNGTELPEFIGKDIKTVVVEANELGIEYSISGNGDIVKQQTPKAETKLSEGSKVILTISDSKTDVSLEIVPNLIGMSSSSAIKTLETCNFGNIVCEYEDEDVEEEIGEEIEETEEEQTAAGRLELNGNNSAEKTVFEQIPSAGTKIQTGTQVKIKVK